MNMWTPYSVRRWTGYRIPDTGYRIPDDREKVVFDKFHVAKSLGDAVDKVRRTEHKALLAEGREDLKHSKRRWLMNPQNMSRKQWRGFKALCEGTLKTARAWAIKELAMSLWGCSSRTWATKAWKQWLDWAVRSQLESVKNLTKTIKVHLLGILNAVLLKADNGGTESINSRIKMAKNRSRRFWNKERFRYAIYFHLGGLYLYPDRIKQEGLHT